MVKIRIMGTVATIDGYEWFCEDPEVLDRLSVTLHTYGPSGSDPDPDYTAAMEAINFYRTGEIIYADPVRYDDDDEDAIY